MKFTDYLILAAVLVWAAFSLYFIVRAKRRGQSLCCGQNCSACGGCVHCEHLHSPKQNQSSRGLETDARLCYKKAPANRDDAALSAYNLTKSAIKNFKKII